MREVVQRVLRFLFGSDAAAHHSTENSGGVGCPAPSSRNILHSKPEGSGDVRRAAPPSRTILPSDVLVQEESRQSAQATTPGRVFVADDGRTFWLGGKPLEEYNGDHYFGVVEVEIPLLAAGEQDDETYYSRLAIRMQPLASSWRVNVSKREAAHINFRVVLYWMPEMARDKEEALLAAIRSALDIWKKEDVVSASGLVFSSIAGTLGRDTITDGMPGCGLNPRFSYPTLEVELVMRASPGEQNDELYCRIAALIPLVASIWDFHVVRRDSSNAYINVWLYWDRFGDERIHGKSDDWYLESTHSILERWKQDGLLVGYELGSFRYQEP